MNFSIQDWILAIINKLMAENYFGVLPIFCTHLFLFTI